MKGKISQEELLEVLEELKGRILIVEGRKDGEALRRLLSGGQRLTPRETTWIIRINSRPLPDVAADAASLAEKHKRREVIVLTDFDRTGRRLASRLRLILQRHRIHANSRIRRDVMNLGIRGVEEISSLPASGRGVWKPPVSGISKLMESDCYGETGADFYEIRDKGLHKGERCSGKARRDRGDIRAD